MNAFYTLFFICVVIDFVWSIRKGNFDKARTLKRTDTFKRNMEECNLNCTKFTITSLKWHLVSPVQTMKDQRLQELKKYWKNNIFFALLVVQLENTFKTVLITVQPNVNTGAFIPVHKNQTINEWHYTKNEVF